MQKTVNPTIFATIALLTGTSLAQAESLTQTLLEVRFDPRPVDIIEVGDFHFSPGQTAPRHNHPAPAIGFVAKGTIVYQVDGHKPQILKEGDAFYEPVGPSILRFDNASATEEAIFIDYNFQQKGEPFIVFEEDPTEHIDRRSLDPVPMGGAIVSAVSVKASEIDAGDQLILSMNSAGFGYVSEGIVQITHAGSSPVKVATGQNFDLGGTPEILIENMSKLAPAKVVTFFAR